jgi:periplasmic divalent cation tolerance protein
MKILLTTYPNDWRKLKNLITALLKKKLIACCNIINYWKSYYIWENKIKKDEEKIVFIKFPKAKENELINFIKKNHPYETPELIILQPESIDEKYLNRIHESTK